MTESSKPPSGRKMKPRAPPPPQAPQPAPRHIFRNTVPEGGGTSNMDAKENIFRPTVDLQLTLPQGYKVSVTEDGSKALMDLLVELCCRYHLNPSLHTLELFSPEGHPLGFKPNALLGSLNVACVLIKEKVWEEKVVRRPAPKVPEKTVRLMVNYHGSQKAVVRVNPLIPLQALIPVICDKCEFDPEHILLLKDSISRHELPLDKSLTELGIKELYVHDQSLDCIRSSTSSLGRPEKRGLLGIFQFSRRKSKTETSMDMDDCDDKLIQNTGTQSDGLSTVSGVPTTEDRPSTLGQSQSVMNIPRMSPKADAKKRRAPVPPSAPTPSMGHTSFDSYQMGLGSESQQRKRKAPAPPPTPTSTTQASNDTSTSPTPPPESQVIEMPTPANRTKVPQSTTASATTVVITVQQPSIKKAEDLPPVCDASPTASSPTPSSSTTDSLAVQDTSSELSHSLDDSDADLDQACSYSSSTVSGSVKVQPNIKTSSSRVEESDQSNQEATSESSSRSETESALNLKLDEVENNRHSAIGNTDWLVPPKPRRSPGRELSQHDLPPTLSAPSSSPPIEPTESNPPESPMEMEEAAPQSWLHSMQRCPTSAQKTENETPEDETVSLGSSSGGSSLPDQGYAASEGLAEGEDSGIVSSPSDTQPTSPDGSLSLDGGRVDKLMGPVRDSSSDSDEGCATWRSIDRHSDTPESQSAKLKNGYEDDPELTAQFHQTLADFEANLADHIDIVSAKETPYTMSRERNEVPVSVVDMDVPVTAIDEVLDDYEHIIVDHEVKSLTQSESAISKGFSQKYNAEPQNKNNNAYTAAVSDNSSSANAGQLSEFEQHSMPAKLIGDAKERKEGRKEADVKENKQSSAGKSIDMQKNGKNTELSSQQKKPDLPPTTQRSRSTEGGEEVYRVYQKKTISSASHGKITPVTSRFGMKTFTVVPPKPSVTHAATSQSGVSATPGAIKIDDQGNMVTTGISRSEVGGSSQAERSSKESSPLLGKAKAFWSSNERQESPVFQSKSSNEKAKENPNGLKNAPSTTVETNLKTSNTEYLKTTQVPLSKPAEKVQPKEVVKDDVKEPGSNIRAAIKEQTEVEGKISVSKTVQQSSDKPAVVPPQLPDVKRDLFFLKPSRRTSSQYVASAINKYAPKMSAKPSYIPTSTDNSLKTQTTGFQRSGHSIQVNPHQFSQSSLSHNKEKVSSASNPPGPKRSMSYPEYVSDSLRNSGQGQPDRDDMLETGTGMNNHLKPNGATHIKSTIKNDRDDIKPINPRSPSPVNVVHSSTKPPIAPKTVSQVQTSNMTKTAPAAKPESSVTVSDGVTTEPPAVTVFGPVQKFRPVIHRSVDKDTSLHSSLMEAIQTGGGKERLKKISNSGPSNPKKAAYVDEENERSALLAAIRGQSNSSRLKKTTSEASKELEKFRKVSSEEERCVGSSPSPPLTSTFPAFAPPPPVPVFAPPPPPSVLAQSKPGSATLPNANPLMNPAMAREAMLEAIRSGSAAERLKKVAAPKKTVQVNGRLGTIQASSSTVPQQ